MAVIIVLTCTLLDTISLVTCKRMQFTSAVIDEYLGHLYRCPTTKILFSYNIVGGILQIMQMRCNLSHANESKNSWEFAGHFWELINIEYLLGTRLCMLCKLSIPRTVNPIMQMKYSKNCNPQLCK